MDRTLRIPLLILAAAVTCSCTNDVLDSSYTNHAQAVADGAIERGWIPDWVPQQSMQLHEVHDVDTNQSALVFSLPNNFSWTPPEICRRADGGEFTEPAFDRDWLPDTLEDYDFYSCPSEPRTGTLLISAVAVSRDGDQVLYWRGFAR